MVTVVNVIIWCCTPPVLNAERGSLRSRSAAAVSSLNLRQISAVLPPERAWGLWLSRQIVARSMDVVLSTPGRPTAAVSSLSGSTASRDQADTAIYFVHGSRYALCSPRTHRRLTSWLPDRTAGVQCRLSAGTTPSIP